MKSANVTYILKQIVCWVLLLQMIHVCIAPVPPIILEKTATFYRDNTCHQRPKSFLKLIAVALLHSVSTYEDVQGASSDKQETDTFLEEFSIGLIWPPFDTDFLGSQLAERLHANFDHYIGLFKNRAIKPASPPPNFI